MKTSNDIVKRIGKFEREVNYLQNLRIEQMSKHFSKRDYALLDFISKEIDRYLTTINELKWALQ